MTPGLVVHFFPASGLGERKYLRCVAHIYLFKVQRWKTIPCFYMPPEGEMK